VRSRFKLLGAKTEAGVRGVEITLYLRDELLAFAASVDRDPKWIAAQIGHTDPEFTFSVYKQVATRRFIDEQAIWTVMRFADEPADRVRSTRTDLACNGRWHQAGHHGRRREWRLP
jgi:hypothetical protein